MIHVFIDQSSTVVQTITGNLSENERAVFLRDYGILFGAVGVITVDDDRPIWIGGSYDATSGVFSPPPQPETIVEETTNDDAPIE